MTRDPQEKIVARDRLVAIVRELKAAGKKVVFTNGCFELLHVGHTRYLREARALGDVLVVGVNSDASVRAIKGPRRPLQPEGDRAEILASLECVDYVTLFDEETPAELIAAVVPDVLVKGGDWPLDQIVGGDTVEAAGGTVTTIPLIEGRSTSELLDRILSEGRVDAD
jgi:rfaE bifunctional protein nucleotidyltransferase chain/domain